MRTMTIRNTSKNVIIKVDEKQMDDTVLWFRELKRAIQQSQTSTYIIRFFDETLSLSKSARRFTAKVQESSGVSVE